MEMMFASFQDLPLELRLKVWQYACRNNPRDVVVDVVKVEEEEQQEQQEQQEQIALEGQPSDDGVYEYGYERGGSEQEAVFAAASTALSASSSSSSSSEEEEEDEHVRVDYIAKTAVPGILHVNHEAREQGLRFYRTCFSTEDAFPSEAQHQHQHQQPQAQAQHGYEPPYEGESRRHVYMNPGIDTLYIRLRREWGFVGNLVRGVHVRDWLNVAFFGRPDPDEPPASTRIWDRLRSMRASGYDFDDGVQIIVLGNCTTVLGELPGERRRKLISLGLLSDSVADPVRCIRTAAIERSTAWDRLFATY